MVLVRLAPERGWQPECGPRTHPLLSGQRGAREGSVAKLDLLGELSARAVARGQGMNDFKGRHFRGEIVLWAVRWYCRYAVSYRDLEAMMTERVPR